MRWGYLLTPWRALRHSLFVCGLSLLIASGAILAGTVLHKDDTPSFPRASASTAPQRGESTSIGALSRFMRQSGPGETSRAAASSAGATASGNPDESVEQQAVVGQASVQGAVSEARVPSVLTAAAPLPLLVERPADQADSVVSGARFKVKTTPTVSEATSRTQTTTSALQELRPGDRLTVPVTFYYCEDSTGGQRRGDGGGFCGVMRDGTVVYSGAAACDVAYLGQRFRIEGDPTGRTYVCADTGGGIHGQHRDIWFMSSAEGWAWQQVVGRSAVIQVLP